MGVGIEGGESAQMMFVIMSGATRHQHSDGAGQRKVRRLGAVVGRNGNHPAMTVNERRYALHSFPGDLLRAAVGLPAAGAPL